MYKCIIVFNGELLKDTRKGKLVVQGAHCLTNLTLKYQSLKGLTDENWINIQKGFGRRITKLQANQEKQKTYVTFYDWFYKENQRKIAVKTNTKEEFNILYEKIKKEFYLCEIVTDLGLTGNIGPQQYCFAVIGKEEDLDKYTKDLKLL